ncbi:hypothetical protein AYI69_g9239, partial [Smittium culicis]
DDASFRIGRAPDYESAMKIVESNKYYKRKHINNPQKLEASIKYLKTSTGSPVDPNFKFHNVPQLRNWKRLEQCLWLFGPRDLGKSAYARSLFKNPLVVKSLDMLHLLKYDNDGIIFDDMTFSNLSREQTIHLLDIETSSPVFSKQTRKEYLIRSGLPRIFTIEDIRDFSGHTAPVNPLEPSRDMFLGSIENMDSEAEPVRREQPSHQPPVNPLEPSRDMFLGSDENVDSAAEPARIVQQ